MPQRRFLAGSPRAAASRSFKLLETLVEVDRFELPTAVPRLGVPYGAKPGRPEPPTGKSNASNSK